LSGAIPRGSYCERGPVGEGRYEKERKRGTAGGLLGSHLRAEFVGVVCHWKLRGGTHGVGEEKDRVEGSIDGSLRTQTTGHEAEGLGEEG